MAWRIEVADPARRDFRKLDPSIADRITRSLRDIASLDDPRSRGKALTGTLAGLWRYRIGDYRVIARIENHRLTIMVIGLGHRRGVYRT